jgi:hypothetical protein
MKALIANFNGDIAAAMRALKEAVPKVNKHAAVNKLLDDSVAKCGEKMSKKVFKRLAMAAWDRAHTSTDSTEPKEVKPRKPNAWFIFRDANIAEVKANNPTMTQEEIIKTLSEMYRAYIMYKTPEPTISTPSPEPSTEEETSDKKRKAEPEPFTICTRRRTAKPARH